MSVCIKKLEMEFYMKNEVTGAVWIAGSGFGNEEIAGLFSDTGRETVLLTEEKMPLCREEYAGCAAVAAEESSPSMLINNFFVKMEDRLLHEYDETSLTNAYAQFDAYSYFTKLAIPYFQNGGVIVNIIPALGIIPARGQSIISALSSGLVNMTRAWALELSRLGLRVYTIAVGLTDGKNARLTYPAINKLVTPKDIFELIVSLENAEMIDGSCVQLDGGYAAGYARDF